MTASRLRVAAALAAVVGLLTGVRGFYIADATRIWPNGNITVHEQITGGTSGPLLDGSASLNVAFENALQTWNQYLGRVQLVPVRGSTVTPGDGDRVNNVLLSSTVFGVPFDAGIIAVTTRRYNVASNNRTEFDITFNSAYTWNSYRGPRLTGIHDMFRIALRQIGLGLGVSAPDSNGQSVQAIMNVDFGDLDTLTFDDIAGVTSLYGPTSLTAPVPASQVRQFEATTDALGTATFTLPDGRLFPVQFVDESSRSPLAGVRAFLFSDPNSVSMVMAADPNGGYLPRSSVVQLPVGVHGAAVPASRPTQVGLAPALMDSVDANLGIALESISSVLTPTWAAVQDAGGRLYATALGAEVIEERIGTLDDVINMHILTEYTALAPVGAALASIDRIPGIGVSGMKVLHWFKPGKLAYAARDGLRAGVRAWYECNGYRPNQLFRITVLRIPVRVPHLVQDFTEFFVFARPMEEPAGSDVAACNQTPGGIAGQVVDAVTGVQVTRGSKVHGLGPTAFVSFGSGRFTTWGRTELRPGTYYPVTADVPGYARGEVDGGSVQVRAGEITQVTIRVMPLGVRRVVIEPLGSTTLQAPGGSVSFRATAYDAAGVAVSPTPQFVWNSDARGVATIGNLGVASAVARGTARITAFTGQVTSDPVAVTVVAEPCTYTVTPSGYTSTSAGGTGTFTVTTDSDCSWTSASLASYITITSSTAGTPGSGTVRFSVAANTSTSQRVGSLLIATRTVSITQAGTTPTPTPTPSPTPSPSGGAYDGTYDFTLTHPVQSGSSTQTIARFFIVSSGRITSSAGDLAGSVTDSSTGSVRFTAPCWTDSGGTATWVGTLRATTPKAGSGTYTCQNNIIGGTWSVSNGR